VGLFLKLEIEIADDTGNQFAYLEYGYVSPNANSRTEPKLKIEDVSHQR
jgi:hypothetical protein